MPDLIAGAMGGGGSGKGGGGGEQRTPIEERDSLDSRQYAQIVDLISEGEIQGLKNGYQSIFLNNTPLQNANGSYNFKNVEVHLRNGTQNQSFIPGTSDIEDEKPVSITVEASTPITRTISDTTTNAVRVTITVPQLQQIQDNGDIVGTSVRLQIQIQYNGGGYSVAIDDTISGRTGDAYQRDYLIGLGGAFPVDVRVVRVTPDSTSSKLANAFSWTSYTEITWAKLRYPNSALVSLRVDAEQFNSIPSRAYLIRGIKVQIPNNATVDQSNGRLIYNGIWNGTFGAAQWTSDPAWVLWDLLTSKRYGFGDHISASQLDKWAFFAASQYASALVPNGFGGYEPRFSCNVNIQTQEEAYKLINDLCSVFRVMPYWSTGTLTISQDKPSDPAYLFTLANVSEEGFRYESSSLKNRPTVAVVSYFDIAAKDKAYEVVEDAARIAKYGVVKTEIDAFACTSRGQAKRLGEWLIYTEWEEAETVSFVASIDAGVLVRPGQTIEISDPVRAGSRRGGRINTATTTTVTVDDAGGITLGSAAQLSVILPTGTVETRAVNSIAGNVFTVASAFSAAPNPNSVWIYQTSNIQTSTWRVLAIQEQEECKYAISALAYNASKYDYIELDRPLQQRDITDLNIIPESPTNLSIIEALYKYRDQVRSKIIISWVGVQGINQYIVKFRKDSGNWSSVTRQQQDFEILDTTPGFFEIEVYSVSAGFKTSVTPLSGSIAALGKTAPPSNVTAFSAALDPDVGVTLNWTAVSDLDLQGYEIWQGSAWGGGTRIGLFAATSKKLGLISTGTTTWWIKALDTSGIYSTTATSTSLTITGASAPTTSGSFAGENFTFAWSAVTGSLSTAFYEVRYGTTSSTWDTATLISTVKGTTFTTKAAWSGTRRFFVAAVDIVGTYGTSNYFDAIVIVPTAPTITQQVVDNNVLLKWNDCTQTLPLDSYELRRGSTWAGATVIGTKKGEFTTVFETTSGTYTYWLAGIDLAGNYGIPGSVSAQVNQPPDYVLQLDLNSTFSGVKTNVVSDSGHLIATVNTTETWQSHFTSRGWTTPQDQINAGYAYYAMPTQTSGQYYEEIDYGTVLPGTKVSMTLTDNHVAGATTITPTISVKTLSTDAWTVYAGVDSVYATNFRYIKAQYDFASAGGNDLLEITALNVRLDSKQKTDQGTGTANASDAGGTVVNFNIPFVDVDAVSVTPATTTPVFAVYDFVDAPNPTSFKVLLFNTSGARVNGNFSWSARGV